MQKIIQIYDNEGEQACLFATHRTDRDEVENDITDAFIQAEENEVNDLIEEVERLLDIKGIWRVYTEELTIPNL